MATGVLRDIRVLDFGRFISAPYCGMLLADMGAEVIRVERPGGEEDRSLGLKAENGENFTYPGLARNKKAITLDTGKKVGRDVLDELVANSDILLHNFGPRAARALRMRYRDIREINPQIIYTAISCYGADGPDAERSGFDPIAQVVSGAAAVNGFEGEPPVRCGVPWTDYGTGLCAALGTVLALRHRDATGDGQEVDCSLLQTAISYMAPMIAEAVVGGKQRPRLGNRAAYLGPCDLYRCRDGYIYMAAATEKMWRSLMKLIGRQDLIESPELRTDEQRFCRREEIDPLVEAWILRHTVAEAAAVLDRAHIPCGVYRSTFQIPDDPQVRAMNMLEYLDLELPGLNRMPVSGYPVRLSKTPGTVSSRPPRVGEHNAEIYSSLLGYSEDRLAELKEKGII